ncbi:hypothetical protein Q4560_06850 [Celeribacter halophilus]|uniref:Uncharacterized protein n=1 Tax=Celeribacter halophilus TaxID=576117 RepID=A0AAW7XTX0_9RHOB|nr:hypothetical protein [Celeribacter halophilus]MDO6456517.1 hypothetical protein [Celeribacter halophilus]MDO6722980.1 hypothetical protein [Celeribacter halophilus]
MTFSDWIALGALTVSGLTFWQTRTALQKQNNLSDREIELIRIQLSKSYDEHAKSKKANVSARMFKIDKTTWRVRIFNSGQAEATNVRLLLDDQNQMVSTGMISGKFPMTKLESGQSVDINAIVHMQTPPKETLRIRWDDESGLNRENTTEITI